MEIILLVWLVIITGLLFDTRGKLQDFISRGVEKKPVIPEPVAQAISANVQEPVSKIAPARKDSQEMDEMAGGRWLGKAGAVAIIIGIGFFLQYAFENNIIGPSGRVFLGLLAGILALALGYTLRAKYLNYSFILTGLGIGLLYLSIFAAHSFYGFITFFAALALMLCVAGLSVVSSVASGSSTPVALGTFGAFITPLLMSSWRGGGIDLLSYVLVLDCAVLAVSLFYKWRKLNLLSFFGTVFTYSVWYISMPVHDLYFTSAVWFLTMFYGLFIVVSIAHHFVRKETTEPEDAFLMLANAVYFSWMLYSILEPRIGNSVGLVALGISILYFALARASRLIVPQDSQMYGILSGLGTAFITGAISWEFDGGIVTLLWIVEAMFLAVVGYQVRDRVWFSYSSIAFVLGAVHFIAYDNVYDKLWNPVANGRFIFLVLIAVAAYAIAYFAQLKQEQGDEEVGVAIAPFVLVAQFVSVYAFTTEVWHYYDVAQANLGVGVTSVRDTVISIGWSLYSILLIGIGFAMKNKFARILGLSFFFLTMVKVFVNVWELGMLYRVVSSVTVGVIALVGSFVFAKYKESIKELV